MDNREKYLIHDVLLFTNNAALLALAALQWWAHPNSVSDEANTAAADRAYAHRSVVYDKRTSTNAGAYHADRTSGTFDSARKPSHRPIPSIKHWLHMLLVAFCLIQIPCTLDANYGLGLVPPLLLTWLAPIHTCVIMCCYGLVVHGTTAAIYMQLRAQPPAAARLLPYISGILIFPTGVVGCALLTAYYDMVYVEIWRIAFVLDFAILWVIFSFVTIILHRKLQSFIQTMSASASAISGYDAAPLKGALQTLWIFWAISSVLAIGVIYLIASMSAAALAQPRPIDPNFDQVPSFAVGGLISTWLEFIGAWVFLWYGWCEIDWRRWLCSQRRSSTTDDGGNRVVALAGTANKAHGAPSSLPATVAPAHPSPAPVIAVFGSSDPPTATTASGRHKSAGSVPPATTVTLTGTMSNSAHDPHPQPHPSAYPSASPPSAHIVVTVAPSS